MPPAAKAAFGESPFHVKGVLYLGTQSFFEANYPSGFAAFLRDLRDPDVQAFLSQRFLAASWYDVMPVPTLIAAEARVMRMPLDQYLVRRTRWQAKTDLSGVYGWILKLASTSAVMARLPRLFAQMFDFATLGETTAEERHGKTSIMGIPEPLANWLETVLSIYCDAALKLAGARRVDVATKIEPSGEKSGFKLITLHIEASWS